MISESEISENGLSLPWPTGIGAARRMALMLCRRHHVACPCSRRRPAPARRTRLLHSLLLRLHRAQRRATAIHHCWPSLRPRLAHASLQKRVAQFAQSLAVIPSTTSTVQSSQLSLGKRVFVNSSTAAMTEPRRSWRSTWPTTTVAFSVPSLPCASCCVCYWCSKSRPLGP